MNSGAREATMVKIFQSVKVFVVCAIILVSVSNLATTSVTDNGKFILHRNRRTFDVRKNTMERTENSLKVTSGREKSAVFATENSTVVYAQIGGTAILPCAVRKFNNGVVSWLRRKESPSLLTVGLTTYSADERFFVEHVRHLQNWGLLIKHVQPSDAGHYECQVSTHPPTSIFIKLKVTEAVAEIMGAPDLHLRAGSTLRLVCTLRDSTEPPSYVFWYQDQRMINYDAGVTVLADRSSSVLLLEETDQRNSGNYTCSPSNAVPAFINVHVLNATEEEFPAMLHANSGNISSFVTTLLLSISFLVVVRSLCR